MSAAQSPASRTVSVNYLPVSEDDDNTDGDDLILPLVTSLKQSRAMKHRVVFRITQLQQLNKQGKFKSQRGGMKLYG